MFCTACLWIKKVKKEERRKKKEERKKKRKKREGDIQSQQNGKI